MRAITNVSVRTAFKFIKTTAVSIGLGMAVNSCCNGSGDKVDTVQLCQNYGVPQYSGSPVQIALSKATLSRSSQKPDDSNVAAYNLKLELPKMPEKAHAIRLCVNDQRGKYWAQNCDEEGNTTCSIYNDKFRVFLRDDIELTDAYLLYLDAKNNYRPILQSDKFIIKK